MPALSANAATKTFYYDDSSTNYRNTGSSTGVAVHIWQDGGDVYPDSPISGTVVEGTDGKIYKFVIEDNNYNRFIFKRTDSWDGKSNDLTTTIEDKALYKADGTSQTVYISQSNYSEPKGRWYLQGNNPMSWSNDEARELKYNESTNCYELTYTIPASTDFQFVYNLGNKDTRYRTKGNNNDGSNDEVELGADEQLYAVSYSMYTLTEMTDVKIQIYKDGSNWKVRFGASPTTDIKVICNNTAKWSTVKLTYTGDATKTVDMTNTSGDLWEYTIRETWTPTGFTFSDGNGNEYKYNQAPENNTTYTNGDYVAPPTPGEISWYLDDTQFTKVSDGEFTLTKQMTNGSHFHIYMQEGSSSKIGYNYNSDTSHGWGINDGDDKQLYVNSNDMHMNADGKFVYTIYRDGSIWKMKVVSTIAVPDKLDLNYKYDNNWQTSVGMTKDGSKFTCTLKGVQQSKDYFFHFNSGSTCYQSTSDQNDDHYTDGDGRKLDFKIQDGDGKYDFKYYYGNSECDLTIEIDFSTMKVTVLRSNYTEPVQPDNQYYFLGDVNNWMNDGTYTNGKEYGYGYSKAENGVRADYQFIPTTINGSDNWYVLDLANTATNGRLWGQFTIIQDNGCFKAAEKEENKNDGRDVINWKGSFAQWANQYDRETATDSYKAETLKAYQSVDAAVADLNSVSQAVKGNRSNFHLDHNLYKGVKIYFNPTDQKIFMTYEDTQDFYIYLSTTDDRAVNGDRKVNVIKESMNNDNYTLDFSSVRVVKSDGTLESDTDNKMEHVVLSDGSEGDELPNGLKFTNYWKIKIPNGLEGPSGQKFVVSIDGAQDEGAKAFTSIFLNNLYFIDGVKVFATHTAEVEVAKVAYRIYGLPADGDPENLQIFAADGSQMAVKDDPNNEFGWVDLQYGDFGYHPTSTSWWAGSVPDHLLDIVAQKTGFYPTQKDDGKFHEVPASHASKCIQWKITYGQRPSAANGMKKTRTGVQLNPATADLTVDRSDRNADWVLNGRHKELVIGIATGVEDIEVEDGEISEEGEVVAPVYYNLQGVRVAEPQHGLYIKVTGNKSEKILVK